jgi:hypothetical protein
MQRIIFTSLLLFFAFYANAQCNNSPGTMPKDTVLVCIPSDTATFKNDKNQVLLPTDALMYIVHDVPNATLGTVFLSNSTGFFDFNGAGLDTCQLYYVSAVVGKKMPNGLVDLTDICLKIANGTPFFRLKNKPGVLIQKTTVANCPPLVICDDSGFIEACPPIIPNIILPPLPINACKLYPSKWDTILVNVLNTSAKGIWSIKEFPNAIVKKDTIFIPNYKIVFGDITNPKTSIKVLSSSSILNLSFTARFQWLGKDLTKIPVRKSCNGGYVFELKMFSDVPITFDKFQAQGGVVSNCAGQPFFLVVNTFGGFPPFQYLWDNGSTGPNTQVFQPGNYSCIVTDANGCSKIATFVTFWNFGPQPPQLLKTDPTCGQKNGSILVSGSSQFTYSWSNGATTPNLPNLAAGTYSVTYTSWDGCTQGSIWFTLKNQFKSIFKEKTIFTCDANNLKPDSTFLKNTYGCDSIFVVNKILKKSNPSFKSIFTCNPSKIKVDSIAYKNAFGCDSFLIISTLLKKSAVSAKLVSSNFNGTTLSCHDANDGILGLENIQGGQSPYQISWNNGVVGQKIENLSAGTYTVTISDADQCTFTQSWVLKNPEKITLEVTESRPLCSGDLGEIKLREVRGGTGTFWYQMDNEQPKKINALPMTFSKIGNGKHDIQVFDANNCKTNYEFNYLKPTPLALVMSTVKENLILGDSTIFRLNPNFIPQKIQWIPSANLSCDTCLTTFAFPKENTIYDVIATDVNGCEVKNSVALTVKYLKNAYVPSVFAPNSKNNPMFTIYGNEAIVKRILSLKVYDRWGNLMHENYDFAPNVGSWDGSFNSNPCNPAVFVYYGEVEFYDGTVKKLVGDVTLIR